MSEQSVETDTIQELTSVLTGYSYKELQAIASSLKLPANLKGSQLVSVIAARQNKKEDLVSTILSQCREQRGRRRAFISSLKKEKQQLRKQKRKCSGSSGKDHYFYTKDVPDSVLNGNYVNWRSRFYHHNEGSSFQVSDVRHFMLRNILNAPLTKYQHNPQVPNEFIDSNLDVPCYSGSDFSSGYYEGSQQQSGPVRSSIRNSNSISSPYDCRHYENNLQNSHASNGAIGYKVVNYTNALSDRNPGDEFPNHISGVQGNSLIYLPTNPPIHSINSEHSSGSQWQNSRQDVQTRNGSFSNISAETVSYTPPIPPTHPVNPEQQFAIPNWQMSKQDEQRHNTIQDYYYLGRGQNHPEFLGPEANASHNVENGNSSTRMLPSPLEFLFNVHTQALVKPLPLPPYWRPIATQTSDCYKDPICSTLPMISLSSEDSRCESCWPFTQSNNNEIPQNYYQRFKEDNQVSFPLIYNYLTASEQQYPDQQNQNVDDLSSSDLSQDQTPSSSQDHQNSNLSQDQNDSHPTEICAVEVNQTTDSIQGNNEEDHENKDVVIRTCRYKDEGCLAILGIGSIEIHEQNCPLQLVKCPKVGCLWQEKIISLESHLFQSHGQDIISGANASFSFPINNMKINQTLTFLQKEGNQIFVISVISKGFLTFATMQIIRPNRLQNSTIVKGSLEVIGSDGQVYSWRGKTAPITTPIDSLWAQGHCLIIDPVTVSFQGENISLHSNISFFMSTKKFHS